MLLWSLLFIVPGIIAALSYSHFFILAEDSTIGALEAMEKSRKMMYEYKWKYFCLGFRFICWAILALFTLGVGFLWLFPYMMVTYAEFYEALKAHHGKHAHEHHVHEKKDTHHVRHEES